MSSTAQGEPVLQRIVLSGPLHAEALLLVGTKQKEKARLPLLSLYGFSHPV